MDLVLHTPRLTLRPLAEEDLGLIKALYCDGEIMKYIHAPLTAGDVDALMPRMLRRGAGGAIGSWCVMDRNSGDAVGEAVLLPMPVDTTQRDWDDVVWDRLPEAEIEIGYEFLKHAWGRGYATEVAQRLLRFAFEAAALPEIVAVTDPENDASGRVLTKAGLVFEGTRLAYGGDCKGYRLTRVQWRNR